MNKRTFQWRPWMHNAALYTCTLGLGFACWLLLYAGESPWWLLATAAGHVAVGLGLTVGNHRLFTHGAFKCNRAWQYVFAVLGTLSWTGSSLQWKALHTSHHRHADTELDPHTTSWTYLFNRRYRNVPLALWKMRELADDPLHRVVHSYYVLVVFGYAAALAMVDYRLLVFGYFAPFALASLNGGMHQVISHGWRKGDMRGARDMALMEYLLPAYGEWLHGQHHKHPGAYDLRTKWWHLDIGGLVIRAIKVPA